LRKNDFTAPKAPRREFENVKLLLRPSDRIRVSNDTKTYYSKNDTLPSIRKKYKNINKRKYLIIY
jgi:hypothetical protein